MDQAPEQGSGGRFRKGTSGNPKGRPRRARAAQTAPTARRDGWQNSASGHGTSRDRRTLTRYGVDIVLDHEAAQLWRSEFLAAAIIEKRPKEAMRRGWSLKLDDKKMAEAISAQAEALALVRKFVLAWQYERAYGGAAIFPVLSGALDDLSAPLDEGAIASVDALHVFEPQELTPNTYYGDIRRPEFGSPETYRLTPLTSGRGGYSPSQIVHATRLIVFPGIQVSRQTQPGQREGFGDSCLSRPHAVLKDFGLAWGSAATLLHEHGKGTLTKDGFADMMSQDGGVEEFDRHMAAMELAWSTLRMNVIGEKDKYERSTGTLGGVAEMLGQFERLMSAAADTPMSVLFGVGSAGLRTGDDETRGWYASVEGDRADRLPLFERLVRMLLLATAGPTGGVEPEVWSVEFPPLHTPNEKEIAETRKLDMDRAVAAVNAGIASADDVAESFYGGDTYSGDIRIDWERRRAQAAVDAEPADALSDDDRAALGDDAPDDIDARLEDLEEEEEEEDDDLEEDDDEEEDLEDEGDEGDEGDEEDLEDEERRTDRGYNRDKNGRFATGSGGGGGGGGGGGARPAPTKLQRKAAIAKARLTAAKERARVAGDKARAARKLAGSHQATPAQRSRAAAAHVRLQARHQQLKEAVVVAHGQHSDARKNAAIEKQSIRRERHEARAAKAREAAHKAGQRAADSVEDGDVSGAERHLARAERHLARAKLATAAAGGGNAHRDEAIAEHIDSSRQALRVRKEDIANGINGGAGPERGALKAHEYRQMSEAYARSLSPDQRLAIQNYSDHTDRILNPALRAAKGRPADTDLYSGDHAPSDVHQDRLNKRRKRRGAAEDYGTTTHAEIRKLDAAIARHRFDRDVVAYRTFTDPDGSIVGSMKPGAVWRDHAYVSTTARKEFLDRFTEAGPTTRVDVRIKIRKGARGAPMAPLSTYDQEREILLPRGSRFRITKISPATSTTPRQIHMETVDGD